MKQPDLITMLLAFTFCVFSGTVIGALGGSQVAAGSGIVLVFIFMCWVWEKLK